MKVALALVVFLSCSAAHAAEVTTGRRVDAVSGEPFAVKISATVLDTFDPSVCINNPDTAGCEMVMIVPDDEITPHPCAGNPDLTGCRYYQQAIE